MDARADCASPMTVKNLRHSGPSFTRRGSGVESLLREALTSATANGLGRSPIFMSLTQEEDHGLA
jgi:hypothetical protein